MTPKTGAMPTPPGRENGEPGKVTPIAPRAFARQQTLLECARQTRTARARHSDTFPKDVFRDRAWDVMIELFIAAGEGRTLCMKDAMVIAGDSPAGSVRRINALEEARLVMRRIDPDDHRRVLIYLTPGGSAAMTSFLRDLYMLDSPVETGPRPAPVGFRSTRRDPES